MGAIEQMESTDTYIKVLLVDDHEMVPIGLAAVLNTEDGIEVVGEASNGMEGIRLAQAYRPDVVLMDLVMDGWMVLKPLGSCLSFIRIVRLSC